MRIPCKRVLLPRSDLRYVKLENVLADSKGSRESRVDAVGLIEYASDSDLLFLRDGETINAARVASGYRTGIAIADVLDRVARREGAAISLLEVGPELLQLLLNAFIATPMIKELPSHCVDFRGLIQYLMNRSANGVLELRADEDFNFIAFEDGKPRRAYAATDVSVQGDGVLKGIVSQVAEGSYRLGFYPRPDKPLIQASPAQVALLCGTIRQLYANFSGPIPPPILRKILLDARNDVRARHPVVRSFELRDGRIVGKTTTDPESLAAAMAAWFGAAIRRLQDLGTPRSIERARSCLEDNRLALDAIGFFRYLDLAAPEVLSK